MYYITNNHGRMITDYSTVAARRYTDCSCLAKTFSDLSSAKATAKKYAKRTGQIFSVKNFDTDLVLTVSF